MRTAARWARNLLLFIVGAAAVSTPAASAILLAVMGLTKAFPGVSRMWVWWTYLPYFHANRRVALALVCGAVPPVLICAAVGVLILVRSFQRRLRPAREGQEPDAPVRAASSLHGKARWLTIKEAKDVFSGPSKRWGGLVMGEAYRVDEDTVANQSFDLNDASTWGRGGKSELLVDPCESGATHGVIIAGSGGAKTTSFYIPTLDPAIGWTGPAVVFDPAGQVGPMVADLRQRAGQEVRTLKPGGDSLDLLAWIDTQDPLAEIHVSNLLDQVFGDLSEKGSGDNGPFASGAREMQYALLLDLLWDPTTPPELRTLRELRARLTTPETKMKGRLETVAEHSLNANARDLARSLMHTTQRTFSGIYRGAVTDSSWLSVKVLADLVSGGSGRVFNPGDVTTKNLCVFIELSEALNRSAPAVCRSVVGAIAQAIYLQEGKTKTRVLMALDEAKFLGKMKVLVDIRDGGRKHGITMVTAWPNVSEIEEIWGKGSAAGWFGSASWRMFAAIKDKATMDMVSADAGYFTVLAKTEGTSTSSSFGGNGSRGKNEGTALQKVPLISPDELRTMRGDEAIIFVDGRPPLRCGRSIYFRRPELRDRYEPDKYRAAAE